MLGEGDNGFVVTFGFGTFLVVVGPGRRGRLCPKQRQTKRRSFEDFVATQRWRLTTTAGAGLTGHRRDASTRSQMRYGRKALADNFGEDACDCPNPGAGHGGQEVGKRVRINDFQDLCFGISSLLVSAG